MDKFSRKGGKKMRSDDVKNEEMQREEGTDFREMARELMLCMVKSMKCMREKPEHPTTENVSKGENFVMQMLLTRGAMLSGDVATEMHVSTARMAVIINGLEQKGFCKRNVVPNDKRRVTVELTDEGKKKTMDIRNLVLNDMESLLREMGEKDSREFVRLIGIASNISFRKVREQV